MSKQQEQDQGEQQEKRVQTQASSSFQPRGLPQLQPKRVVKSTSISTFCKMLKVAIGSGVLAMPRGISKVYVLGGIITIFGSLVLQYYSWLVLTKAIEEKTKLIEQKKQNFRKKMSIKGLPDQVIEIQIQQRFEGESSLNDESDEEDNTKNPTQSIQLVMMNSNIENPMNDSTIQEQKEMAEIELVTPVQSNEQTQTAEDEYYSPNKDQDSEKVSPRQPTQTQTPGLPKKQRIISDYRNYKDPRTLEKEMRAKLKQMEKEQRKREEERRRIERKIEYLDFTIYDFIRKEFHNNKWTLVALQISTLLLLWGCNVSYCTFWSTTLEHIDYETQTIGGKLGLAIGLAVSIFAFSFYSRLESLRSYIYLGSYLSLIILYFVISLCLYQLKLNNQEQGNNGTYFQEVYPDPIITHLGWNPLHLPEFFGTALYSFDINGVITEIRQEMLKTYRFPQVLLISMLIEALIYTFVGVIGYLAYGQYTEDIITVNVTVTIKGIGSGIHILYAISLMITVMLHNVVAFKILNELLNRTKKESQTLVYRLLIRIPFIFSFVFTSSYFQGFSIIISLQGCVTTIIIGFVLPYILFYKLFKNKVSKFVLAINTFVLLMGLGGGLAGVVFTFIQ